MKNTAYQKAIELLKNNTLPFFKNNESDFLIARNSAMNECTRQIIHGDIFAVNDWYEIREEILKINYEKFLLLNK